MSGDTWSDEDEANWQREVQALFSQKLEEAFQQHDDPLEVGNQLGDLLKTLEKDIAKLVILRAVHKWASKEHLPEWKKILDDETMLEELRAIGTSIANTMRPLAGNTFASWVSRVLNASFDHHELPMRCMTRGELKQSLSKKFVVVDKGQRIDLKPDIDLVVVYKKDKKDVPLAIVSAKTTLAERVMQTINWTRYKKDERLPQDVRDIKLYLVTAWETFLEGDVNRGRVQELDGVYVCNTKFEPHGNIKPFRLLLEDLKALLPSEAISSS